MTKTFGNLTNCFRPMIALWLTALLKLMAASSPDVMYTSEEEAGWAEWSGASLFVMIVVVNVVVVTVVTVTRRYDEESCVVVGTNGR